MAVARFPASPLACPRSTFATDLRSRGSGRRRGCDRVPRSGRPAVPRSIRSCSATATESDRPATAIAADDSDAPDERQRRATMSYDVAWRYPNTVAMRIHDQYAASEPMP